MRELTFELDCKKRTYEPSKVAHLDGIELKTRYFRSLIEDLKDFHDIDLTEHLTEVIMDELSAEVIMDELSAEVTLTDEEKEHYPEVIRKELSNETYK